jgi:phage terminase large subunit GpA-like protein
MSERSSTGLQALSEHYSLGVVPPEGRFLVASVDMQINRFVLQVVAHGKSNERWLVDRRNITESPRVMADGSKARVEPFTHPEDFNALLPILTDLKYPDSSGGDMNVRVMTLDTGGKDEAAVNAYAFWRKAAGLGLADRLMLIKGSGLPGAKRLNRSTAQKVDGVPLWIVGTNIIKTEVAFDLIRQDPGPGKIHTSSELQSWFFDELAAEEQDPATGKWFKKNAKGKNEALDLLVYDAAAYIAIGGEGLQWDEEEKLPVWARRRVPAPPEPEFPAQTIINPASRAADPTQSGKIDWAALGESMNG